jgi:hypothetical protein
MLLAEGGYRVTWDCGAVKVRGQGTGVWEFVDLELLDAEVGHEHQHRHHMPHFGGSHSVAPLHFGHAKNHLPVPAQLRR